MIGVGPSLHLSQMEFVTMRNGGLWDLGNDCGVPLRLP